jgi:hypothetical protein
MSTTDGLPPHEPNSGTDKTTEILAKLEEHRKKKKALNGGGAEGADDYVGELNQSYAVAQQGGEVLIIREDGDDVHFVQPADFHLWHANMKVRIDGKEIPVSKAWLAHPDRRQYSKIVFDPRDEEPDHYNLWHGFACEPGPGSCAKFLAHIHDNIGSGNAEHYTWILGFLAHLVQRPWEKPGVGIVLRGEEGVGKGFFAGVVRRLLPQHFVAVSHASHITGRFNAHLKRTIVVYVDEAFWAGDKTGEGALKHLITDPQVLIEGKHKDPITFDSMHRFIISSNENWVVPAGLQARRWFVLDVGKEHANDRAYFQAIEDELSDGGLEALMAHLMNFDLDTVDVFTAPKTKALLDQKDASLEPKAAFWLDTLQRGFVRYMGKDLTTDREVVKETEGWPKELIKDLLFSAYCIWIREHNVRSRIEGSSGFFRWFKDKNLLPGATTHQPHGGKRILRYPPLEVCRTAFDTLTGQPREWDELDQPGQPDPKAPTAVSPFDELLAETAA